MDTPISDTFTRQLQQMRTDVLAQLRAQRGGKIGRAEAAAEAREHQSDDWAQADAERDLAFALEERESAELLARHILGRNADPVALDAYADVMDRVVTLTRAEVVDGGGDPDELGRAFLDAAQRVGAQTP